MNYLIKRELTKIRRIVQNPKDFRLLRPNKSLNPNGVLIVIHESQELGASLLAFHIAEEMIKQGNSVYIISRQFGKLNEKYSRIAPTQIALSIKAYQKICKYLTANGYRRALLITASTGELVKVTKKSGFKVVSMIHELKEVIEMLHLENATKEMLENSDKVLFSTTLAKNPILKMLEINDNSKILIKPQGIYFSKPTEEEIENQKQTLLINHPEINQKRIISGIGNTTERKGFDIFIKTAKLLPDYFFIWVGKEENYYDEIRRKTNMPSNFIYPGKMNSLQLSAVYSLSDVYLMCSRFDTLPSTIFEALLFDVPVVGAKTSGGIIDVINDDNGYLTDKADASQFAEAIRSVVNKKMKIKKLDNSFGRYVKYLLKLYED